MLGNTTAATGKGFAIGSAALTAMALLASYVEEIKIWLGRLADSAGGAYQAGKVFFVNQAADLPGIVSGIPGARVIGDGSRAIAENGDLLAMVAGKAGIADFMQVYNLSLMNPMLLGGLFIGAMMGFVFCALTIKAVGRAASAMVEEVRRQFREDKGILAGTSEPDYAKCVDIATRGALKTMVIPALLPILVPVIFGLIMRYLLGDYVEAYQSVGALIMVGTIVGILMANFLNNGGGAWDNAKKYIEEGNHGGKKSPAHAAAVVGDTIGDPFKDTAGPSIHVLVKLLSTICLVTAVLFV
jgi:K(+)-stimulated pyrophosphate-energized sodium pump